MPRQRTHHMLKPLAHQHHLGARRLQCLQVAHAFFLQQRLQLVLEFFFAQQIEPVACNSAQHGMHNSSRRLPVRRIQKRPQQSHHQHQAPPHRARDKRLAVPGKKRNRPDRRQLQQASFHPPIHRRRGPWPRLRLGRIRRRSARLSSGRQRASRRGVPVDRRLLSSVREIGDWFHEFRIGSRSCASGYRGGTGGATRVCRIPYFNPSPTIGEAPKSRERAAHPPAGFSSTNDPIVPNKGG